MLKFGIILLSSVVLYASGGLLFNTRYESYLCAARRNFTFGLLSCHEDCQLSHGADGGACLDVTRINRYNCICGNPTGRLPARAQQCIEAFNPGYQELCEMDCKCNHGAVTGRCDYNLNACFCEGSNPLNDGCPAQSYQHFKLLGQMIFKLKVGKLGKLGIGPTWLYDRI